MPIKKTKEEFIQHFKEVSCWGGIKELENIQHRDTIKNNFCKQNNIKLVRISYNENISKKVYNIINH